MKTSTTTTNVLKLTLCLGAAALFTAAPNARAQSSDALIDKLVEKGILTLNEANALRDEADKDFKTSFQARTGMPDWVTGYKFSGDVRGRFEQFSGDNPDFTDRVRLRYRVRVGVAVSMLDDLEAGLRLTSGDAKGAAGNALSGNSTLQDNGSKKNIYLDAAYGKWTPINAGNWMLSTTVGKMDNPFAFTPMVFDADYTPEGAAFQGSYLINDKHTISFAGAAFVLDELPSFTSDPFMYGGQILWTAKWTPKWSSSLGLGAFSIVSANQLNTANVPYINQGNTRQPVEYTAPGSTTPTTLYVLKNNYNPVIANASVTYTAETFPFYTGAFPIKFAGEVISNPSASEKNNGFWVGVTFGKSGTKKTWDLTYRYEYLEADAWYDQLVDDDNGAFYPGDMVSANSTAGYFGGTNVKGHMVKFNYSFTDSFTFSVTCYVNTLIDLAGLTPSPIVANTKTSSVVRLMADLMWKF